MHFSNIFGLLLVIFAPKYVNSAGGGAPTKGTYKVANSNGIYCIEMQVDLTLYLTYDTNDGEKDTTVHVPTTSTVDKTVSVCDTTIMASGLTVKAQLLRINLYHMDGWTIDLAFTTDNRFKTNSGSEFTLFQVNITANYGSDKKTYPDAIHPIQNYYLHVDPEYLADISSSIYADVDHSYYCPSKQKYAVNKNSAYGNSAYIMFQYTTLQAYKTSNGFGDKETCPSDQHVTDMIPIIVGSCLAGFIIITLAVYLVYRSCLPEEIINLVNPESHFAYENELITDDNGDKHEL